MKAVIKRVAIPVAVLVAISIALSLVFQIPYVFTLIGWLAWVTVGHFITLDDDMPGGWSNPDNNPGTLRRSILAFGLKAALLALVLMLAANFPWLRQLGAE